MDGVNGMVYIHNICSVYNLSYTSKDVYIYTIQFVSITRKHNGMIRICFRLPKLTKNWLQAASKVPRSEASTVYDGL